MSHHRHWRLGVQDIGVQDLIECAEKIEAYTHGLDFESFAGNSMVIVAAGGRGRV